MQKLFIARWTMFGILFGGSFPVIATILEINLLDLPLNLTNIALALRNNPVLWIVYLAPIVLGLVFSLVGIREDKLQNTNKNLNEVINQISELQNELEQRVDDRTSELETANQQLNRRASQFEAVAEVVRNISTTQNLETLLPKIVHVISELFGFYHVGIFLLDAESDYAVLRAANSQEGQKMLERGHKLKVGETGIVGNVTSTLRPRIAMNTGTDAVYFNNPDLPETRSEMALPLIIDNRVVGALDVQSKDPNAFSPEDISTLTILADQVSIAIQNVRLYDETRQALARYQALYQQFNQSGWRRYRKSKKLVGIRYGNTKSTILREPLVPEDLSEKNTVNLPVNLRGQKIGLLKMVGSDGRSWTQDDFDIATAIVERAAIAMENSRLLDDAQRLATREQIIGEISASVSSSPDIEDILRTAVKELGHIMGGAEVVLELGIDPNLKDIHNELVE